MARVERAMTIERLALVLATAAILTGTSSPAAHAQEGPARPDDDSGAAAGARSDSATQPAAASPVGEPAAGKAAAGAAESNVQVTGDESGAATRVASFAVTKLKDSPAVVTVISGEDIRTSGARDLIDI